MTRILAIMGSGETAPAMARVHRRLFDRLDSGRASGEPARGVVVDTPYAFQENAPLLSDRTVSYFRDRIRREMTVASLPRDARGVSDAAALALARVRDADYVFAGPGSPSYALETWRDTPVIEAVASKLETGGVVTMASAAALTLGLVTVPVYEIYKVGEAPRWLPGLDVLGRVTGLRAAVLPHFDNSEGRDHDTRFCYLGERRLRVLEAQLPENAFVLGVDGHTALILDLDARTATVEGLATVTIRVNGHGSVLRSGDAISIDEIGNVARGLRAEDASRSVAAAAPAPTERTRPAPSGRDPIERLHAAAEAALGRQDPKAALGALLEIDTLLEGRLRGGEDSPELDAARLTFRALLIRLADELSAARATAAIDPFVTALIELRSRARADRDWGQADFIRERLVDAGVEVQDRPDGASEWSLSEG